MAWRVAQALAERTGSGLGLLRRARGISDTSWSVAGAGPDGRDRRHRRLSRPRGPRGRSAGPALRRACRRSSSSACPTRRSPRAASACAPRWPRSALRFRPSGSPSTCRRPTCPRKARITTCRSRLCLLAAIGATDAETLSHYVAVGELSLDGRIAPSPGVLLAALHASALRQRADLPRRAGRRGRLGRASSTSSPRPTCWRCSRISRALRWCRAAVAAEAEAPEGGPDLARSKGRKSPSARSRSPRPAATIC